ncbi:MULTISPECIES: hypothetical protein [Streptacidiphilus]|uniref:hypothetical protein n=1 Tax=Streptacidiphilus TaxID=228398 RepID=UPI00056B2BAD|nr:MULTISPECIES: hypothetical protein [Streptacidiphilus]
MPKPAIRRDVLDLLFDCDFLPREQRGPETFSHLRDGRAFTPVEMALLKSATRAEKEAFDNASRLMRDYDATDGAIADIKTRRAKPGDNITRPEAQLRLDTLIDPYVEVYLPGTLITPAMMRSRMTAEDCAEYDYLSDVVGGRRIRKDYTRGAQTRTKEQISLKIAEILIRHITADDLRNNGGKPDLDLVESRLSAKDRAELDRLGDLYDQFRYE